MRSDSQKAVATADWVGCPHHQTPRSTTRAAPSRALSVRFVTRSTRFWSSTHFSTLEQLRFTRKFDQQRHERSIHTGERPFKCNRCSAEFSRSDALTRHLRLEGQCSPSSTAPDEPSATSASSTTSSDFAFKASPQRRSSFAMPSMGPVSVSPSVRSASPLEQFRENLQQQRRNTPSPTASMAASSPLKFPSKLSFMMNPATTTPTTGTRSRTSSFTFV